MRKRTRRTRGARWLVALLVVVTTVLAVPAAALADELTVGNGGTYTSLLDAVNAAQSGDTVKLVSDLDATNRVLVDGGKSIVIDGDGHVITRSEDFERAQDTGRGGYHAAMIEVANRSKLTLQKITLDDGFLHDEGATKFELQGGSDTDNTDKVQDGIISAYGDGGGTIELGDGAVLKNFGGLSAVYISGEGGEGATLIMRSGSKICDDTIGTREGGYAAIFNHGGTVKAEQGSSIENVDGRAVYADNAGVTTFAGTIKGITSSEKVVSPGDAGVAYYGNGNTEFTLASGGVIEDINSHDNSGADSVLHLISCTFKTEQGSEIRNIETCGIADMNGATVDLSGSISNCNAKDVFFRMRGTQGTFNLQQTGSITKCTTTDVALVYLNGGQPTITIAGAIDGINKPALYMSVNGSRKDGAITLTETGVITNITGYGMRLEDPSHVIIAGTITNCSSYGLQYYPKAAQSLLTIKSTATIENNNGGGAQVRAQNSLLATNAQEHIVLEPGGLDGNTTVDLNAFDVTLDADYDAIQLGNAGSAASTAIKAAVAEQHTDWTVVGSSAIWMQPSTSEVHFTVPRSSSMKKTALFAALIPLNEDGTPVEGADVILNEVENADPVDVTLTGLTAGQSYAMMFVNNAEYTLAPDDVTIYTGGGQGDETYDNGGLPALSIANSVDKITKLEIDDVEVTETDLMASLLSRLQVTYTGEGNTVVTDDSVPGEYVATLSWREDMEPNSIRINGNEVADEFGTGTLIVRHTQDVSGATSGDATHELLKSEPADPVKNAAALAKGKYPWSDPKFYTNDDESREISADGIQILDDDLLVYEGEDRTTPMEMKAADFLGDPGEGSAYRYEFHYLDLVDAYNGNAWVSCSGGTTVWLPYPEGVTAETADDLELKVIHYKDLHREYGITGQEDVEQAIADCEMETMEVTYDANGIMFDVDRSGFSPFAVVWKTAARTITATADDGSTVTPSGAFSVSVDEGMTFTIAAKSGYAIKDVTLNGASVLDQVRDGEFTVPASREDQTLLVTSRSTGGGGPVTPTERFTITSSAGEGGSISPSGTHEYAAGSDVSFSISPDEGYTVGSVIVDGVNVGQRTSYTFADLDADHTISVTFMPGSAPADPDDTGVSDWLQAGDHIAFLHGYGDGSGTFGPENDMTRAEVAQMFYNLLLDKSRGDVEVKFEDIPADAYYAEAVLTLASRGIVNGTSPETYEPNRPITRAEFVAIAMRFSNGEFEGENTFVDVPEDAWYRDYVVGATSFGWIVGYQDGSHRFGPEDTITRGQATMVTNRMLGRVADGAWIVAHLDDVKTFVDLGQDHYAFFDVVEATNAHDYERADGTRYESWTGLAK